MLYGRGSPLEFSDIPIGNDMKSWNGSSIMEPSYREMDLERIVFAF